jgi:acyl-CoA-binding protein
MAAGALTIAALGLLWLRRRTRKGCSRGRGGGGCYGHNMLPRDLLLDDDDGNDGHNVDEPDEELRQVFDEAARVARSIPDGSMDRRDQLMLYGLYKQALEGDRNEDGKPSNLNIVACAKYDAWGKFKGLPKQFAMRKVNFTLSPFFSTFHSIICVDRRTVFLNILRIFRNKKNGSIARSYITFVTVASPRMVMVQTAMPM